MESNKRKRRIHPRHWRGRKRSIKRVAKLNRIKLGLDRCLHPDCHIDGTIVERRRSLWWEAKLSLSRAQLIIKAAAGQSNFHARPYLSFVRRNASQCLAKVSRKIEFFVLDFSSSFSFPSIFFSFFFFLAPHPPPRVLFEELPKVRIFFTVQNRTFIESFSTEVSCDSTRGAM